MADKKEPYFTEGWLKKITPPDAGQTLYFDKGTGSVTGLGLRVTSGTKKPRKRKPNGEDKPVPDNKNWFFQQRIDGKVVRMTIGPSKVWSVKDARDEAKRLSRLIDTGEDPRELKKAKQAKREKAKADSVTLKEVFDSYLATKKLAERTRYDYERYMRSFFEDWMSRPIVEITKDKVTSRYKKIGSSSSGIAQANSAMRVLRALFNYAIATWEDSIQTNPVETLSRRKLWEKDKVRDDHLTLAQVGPWLEAVRNWSSPVMAGFAEFVLLTGCRRSEATDLTWKDVKLDTETPTLTFRETKNGTDRTIPVAPRCREILEKMQAHKVGKNGPVFPTTNKEGKTVGTHWPKKIIATANKAAGAEVTLHGLRRSFTSIMVGIDCPTYPLKKILGHSTSGDVTETHYVRLGVEHLRPWLERYEQALLGG